MTSTLATIIVVTHNSASWLSRMCAAIAAQTETRWRLVVVDNASRETERPHQADLPPGASFMSCARNLGFAEANNLAAKDADTPYLVFLNPDAFPEPRWLEQLIATAERYPQAAAIGSTQISADAPNLFDGTGDVMHASGLAYRSNHGQERGPAPPLGESFAACAAAMLVRREVFEAAGGFDARYFCYVEDVDLCFRLRLLGWRILQSPDAIVAHVGGGVSGARSPFAQFHGARNRLWTFVKCMPAPLFWLLLPVHLSMSALTATFAVLTGRGFSAWRGFIDGFGGWSETWRERSNVQTSRSASTGEIARMLAWNPLVFVGRKPVIKPLA